MPASNDKKVVVGISGGVDSAVAALKLKADGYSVIGVHFNIYETENNVSNQIETIQHKVGIPIETIQAGHEFRSTVIEYFKKELLAGRSPSLCTVCNPLFKWKVLLEAADRYNAGYVASGHYVSKKTIGKTIYIEKGKDEKKDQSYYFWKMPQTLLQRILFPLGGFTKEQTKELADKYGLEKLSGQKESTGLCFSQGLNFSEIIDKLVPEAGSIPEGYIIDKSGKRVGRHRGYIFYTIGQKRDLDFFNPGDTKCVISVDAANNIVVAGEAEDLWAKEFVISGCNFANISNVLECKELSVKIRGVGWNPKGFCSIHQTSENSYMVRLASRAWAPAPGQPVVFYHHNTLLGGGVIS